MSQYDCFAAWGFSSSPFNVFPLLPDADGKKLLIGRDDELELIATKLHQKSKITCLDGHLGIGKTSLVNVATYTCFEHFLNGETNQLLIPCKEPFQLHEDDATTEKFTLNVFLQIAQALLEKRSEVENLSSIKKELNQLNKWLNVPVPQFMGAGLNYVGVLNASQSLNTTKGFESSGFELMIKDWLKKLFKDGGGVVCVIDNIELLLTAKAARQNLEKLRDRLFNVVGLRWVFCGANGVIRSLVDSPRLSGYLNTPVVDLGNVRPHHIPNIINTRINHLALEDNHYLPIEIADIEDLYFVINFNLRNLFALIENYCSSVFKKEQNLITPEQKRKRFKKWLYDHTIGQYSGLSSFIGDEAWAILDTAMGKELQGTFRITSLKDINRSTSVNITPAKFKNSIKELISTGLIEQGINDNQSDFNFGQNVFTVTSKGCLVHFARLMRSERKTYTEVDPSWLKRVNHLFTN